MLLAWLADLSVRTRIIIAALIAFLLCIVMLGAGWSMFSHQQAAGELNAQFDRQAISLQYVLRGMNELLVAEGASPASRELIKRGVADFASTLTLFESHVSTSEIAAILGPIKDQWKVFEAEALQFANRPTNQISTSDDDAMIAFGKLVKKSEAIDKAMPALQQAVKAHTQATLQQTLGMVALLLLVLSLLLVATFFWLYRQITAPIQDMQATMSAIERDKDMRQRVQVTGHNEIGQASEAFNAMVESFQQVLNNVSSSVDRLGNASAQVALASQHARQFAEQQQDAVSHAASAVESIRQGVGEIHHRVAEAITIARRSSGLAEHGGQVVQNASANMKQMAGSVRAAADQVSHLSTLSSKIGDIVGTIREIADQTNLLALNAAIEAARAGEQGRGFAVVADEVRKLAERTAKATDMISQLVEATQSDINITVNSMTHSVDQVSKAAALADDADSAIADINAGIRETVEVVGGISQASEQQTSANQKISLAVADISRLADASMQSVEETTRSVQDMEKLASGFQQMIGVFKI